ncbi:MAG: hypothetical protein HYV55_01470 [Parcubacteria group bacterium]|nr:hypothetical protein [Parcubacteria group bacterium]
MRKALYDLAKAAGWWFWIVLGMILANYSRMRWDDFGWVGFLALLAGANSYLIMSRYWYVESPQPDPQPEIRPTLIAFLLGVFFGVGVNHGFIEAFASVAGVLVGLGGIYVAMFIVGAVAEMSQPPTSPAGGH